MAELIQVLSKIKRDKLKPTDIEVMEEIIDVKICLYSILDSLSYWQEKMVIEEANIYLNEVEEEISKETWVTANMTIEALITKITTVAHRLCIISYVKLYQEKSLHVRENHLCMLIIYTMAYISIFIKENQLDNEQLDYIEDIKLERIKTKIQTGEIK